MMKKNRLVFYSIFGAMHLFIFFFSLYMDSQKENIQFLLAMQKRIWMLKYASLLLLILFAVNIFLHYMDNRRNEQEKKQLASEMNNLKAKLYDLEQKAGKGQQAGT
jgi:ABC-type nickel/cobalt efflux system permease component RcnA